MSDTTFTHDVFLSHSTKDKAVVRAVAERLRGDGLRVWFDEWEIHPGDSIPKKLDDGLEQSRVLVLCMSENAFGSDWAKLEESVFRFRDPLNKERRFIPLRLDDAPIKGSLAQFLYIKWLPEDCEQEYAKLLEACRPPAKSTEAEGAREQVAEKVIQLDRGANVWAYAFSPDGKSALTGDNDGTVQLWDVETGRCLCAFERTHRGTVMSVALSLDQRRVLTGAWDRAVRLWDVETGRCLRTFELHADAVWAAAWSADYRRVLSGSTDKTLRLWDVETGRCLRVLDGHTAHVRSGGMEC